MFNDTNCHIQRDDSTQDEKQVDSHEEENIIKKTREIIKNMTEEERFQKAKAHVMDALYYHKPRPYSQSNTSSGCFKFLYKFNTSTFWRLFLFIVSYLQMYLVTIDQQNYGLIVGVESFFLLLFWADIIIHKYIQSFDMVGKMKLSTFIDWKVLLILCATIDWIIFIAHPAFETRPILPFKILRCFLPLMYDTSLRHTFFSIFSAHLDIMVFFTFFGVVTIAFGLIGSRTLTIDPFFRDPVNPLTIDPYANNYLSLGKMIFNMYVLSSYDGFPDDQWYTIQNFQPNYIFFLVFILLNFFLFTTIPGTLVYNKFRSTYSKLILMDELKQQHSLIIAFVTLAQENSNMSMSTMIHFLNYLYRYKIRYVQFITDICIKLDENNNKSVQVREFMHLARTILDNAVMMPPMFDDVQCWVKFRRFINRTLKLKLIVQHWMFQVVVSILILFSFINAILYTFDIWPPSLTIDDVVVWLFMVELAMRVTALGPEMFFTCRWNKLDSFFILIGWVFFWIPSNHDSSSTIARVGRIFRLASIIRISSHSNFLESTYGFRFISKLRTLFQLLLQIFPIIIRFLPLFLFIFYVFSIIGMEIFYSSYQTAGSPNYNSYDQFSSFRNFISSQFLMMQILVEAGWSVIAYDHCWRHPQFYALIMIFFCFMHIIIVSIISTLIKGIFWEVYFTVDRIFNERDEEHRNEREKEKEVEEKKKEIDQIKQQIREKVYINPDTMLKRQLYENNLDEKIFFKLIQEQKSKGKAKFTPKKSMLSRKSQMEDILSQFQISINEIGTSKRIKNSFLKDLSSSKDLLSNDDQKVSWRKVPLSEIQEFADQDLQSEVEDMFHKILLDPRVNYSHIVGSSKINSLFLKDKFIKPEELIQQNQFILDGHPLYNKQSMNLHIFQMHSILHIYTSKREKKTEVIRDLRENDIIDDDMTDKLIKKKLYEKVFKIDTNGTLRKMFLSETNEELIRKFQVQYFSHLYGSSFKAINRMNLEPLLRVEASLTYALRNILRYPQIENLEFFQMLTHVEDQYSNKVLKKGSLFKFLYKIDGENTWFSIEFKKHQELKVHFVKTGVWCYEKDMNDHEVYYSRDVFYWGDKYGENKTERKVRHKFMKRFYQSFEGLAFSLLDEKYFFSSNPKDYVHDLFIQTFSTEKLKRFVDKDIQISKVMVVVLSKEEKRKELNAPELPYSLTDLSFQEEQISFDFTYDDSQNDTYEKLKNLTARDHQKIVESEGLPFSYITNLMKELSDTFKSYGQNFTYQVEKVFNDQFKLLKKRMVETKEERQNHDQKLMTDLFESTIRRAQND